MHACVYSCLHVCLYTYVYMSVEEFVHAQEDSRFMSDISTLYKRQGLSVEPSTH